MAVCDDIPARARFKIALVHPPQQEGVRSLFTFHKRGALGAKPPLAVLSLAASLRESGFSSTWCLDAQLDDLSAEQVADELSAHSPDLVGITVWTDFWYPAWLTVRRIRERIPAAKIVLGGPHCLVYPAETLRTSGADFLVCGEGEETLVKLATRLSAREDVNDLPGLWKRTEGRLSAPLIPIAVVSDLDKIPFPDRTLLPYRRYSSVLNARQFETTAITSRGCPFRCVFCKMERQKVHVRSAESVVREFRSIYELGIRDIQVYDDTFTWSKKRVLHICQGLLDGGIRVNWAIRDRVNKCDEETYRLLKQAGCYRVHFGVESGSPEILKATGKGITLTEALAAVRSARAAGLKTLAYFMFGFMNETYEDARKTIAFAKELDADYAVFAALIPYPGTQLYDEALKLGIIPVDFWREYTCSPRPHFEIPHLIEQHLNRRMLIKLKDRALWSYYFSPRRLLREVAALRSAGELYAKGRMGFNVISDFLSSCWR